MPTTYYVRVSGDDGDDGLSPAAAWATIGKALGASGISSGDTVYIGAGVYRENRHGRDDLGDGRDVRHR